MKRTGSKPNSPQTSYDDIFSDDSAAITKQQGKAQDFQSQLKSIIDYKQLDNLKELMQAQPEAWSCISAEDLGKLLLLAVKKGRLELVDVLVKELVPGKAAAISLDMQLELVEAAHSERNSAAEMKQLLDTLLQGVDSPVHLLDELADCAANERKLEIARAVSSYKDNLAKTRNRQYETSIHDAASSGDVALLQKELDAKLGIPPLDDKLTGTAWLFNMLHRWVAELITTGAAKALVNEQTANRPLLHAAVASGSKETVLLLIEKGADLSTVDENGHTALSMARDKKNREIVALLEKLHAPDRAPIPGSVLAPIQGASGSRMAAGQAPPRYEGTTGRTDYSDTVKTFKNLLPDIASVLSDSEDLARELNDAEHMSVAQAGLFTAGYLAGFEPTKASDWKNANRALGPLTDDVAEQLQASCKEFKAAGMRLEASKADDICRVLDNLVSATFAESGTMPDIQTDLRNAGLCNLLKASVMKAVSSAHGNPHWSSASADRRKEIFTACLNKQLRHLKNRPFAVRGKDIKQALYDQLLQRQIGLLSNYCEPAKEVTREDARRVTDYSADFY